MRIPPKLWATKITGTLLSTSVDLNCHLHQHKSIKKGRSIEQYTDFPILFKIKSPRNRTEWSLMLSLDPIVIEASYPYVQARVPSKSSLSHSGQSSDA